MKAVFGTVAITLHEALAVHHKVHIPKSKSKVVRNGPIHKSFLSILGIEYETLHSVLPLHSRKISKQARGAERDPLERAQRRAHVTDDWR